MDHIIADRFPLKIHNYNNNCLLLIKFNLKNIQYDTKLADDTRSVNVEHASLRN